MGWSVGLAFCVCLSVGLSVCLSLCVWVSGSFVGLRSVYFLFVFKFASVCLSGCLHVTLTIISILN